MADQSAPRHINAPFPAPPPFWKHFTEENISKLEESVKAQIASNEKSQEPKVDKLKAVQLRELDIPQGLSYLVPPTPPGDESYKIFSSVQTLASAPLPEGIESLYPDPKSTNPAPHLLRITKSILLNFLELCSMLSLDSSLATQKNQDFVTLFINAHHLINQYRPHQARETLLGMLEAKVEEGKKEIEQLDTWKGDVKQWLDQLRGEGAALRTGDQPGGVSSEGSDRVRKAGLDNEAEAFKIWDALRDIEGEEHDAGEG